MELFETQKNFILVNGSVALFCDRLSGHLSFGEADKLNYEWNPVCLGQVKGLIGKVKFFPDGDSKLMLITETKKVGDLPCMGQIHKITKVATISLSSQPLINLDIALCKNHHFGMKQTERITVSPDGHKPLLRSFHEQVKKTAESVKPKSISWKHDVSSTASASSSSSVTTNLTSSSGSTTNFQINKDARDRDKFEKRMLEEYEKMFQEGGDCFYICQESSRLVNSASQQSLSSLNGSINELRPSNIASQLPRASLPPPPPPPSPASTLTPRSSTVSIPIIGDITSNIQRQNSKEYNKNQLLWRRADEKFFWNKSMMKEAIDSAEQLLIHRFGKSILTGSSDCDNVIVRQLEQMLMPIIQGYVDMRPFELQVPSLSPIRHNLPNLPPHDSTHDYAVSISLISRRNRYRAGTRYRRRGVDEKGNVANYVETEQILKVDNDKSPHIVSFVQVRGSVPVFWSQTSLKYRPPIILERTYEENQSAFEKHFDNLLKDYESVVVVNLVDTLFDKPERKIANAYLEKLIQMNSDKVSCVMFDFHDYCKGLQFDNVSILINGVSEIFRDMKYTWLDKNGVICEQKSIFRVNCVDCLDRTNVVQCMLAGVVMETQLRKLGLLSPEESLPSEFYQILQLMWANNGDAISRQYSGTAAMKGDFTRTGTRTMNGLMKDGVSSVNRYYQRLRELSRQSAIDLMVGFDSSSEVVSLQSGRSDTEQKLMKQKEENIKELTCQCRRACLKSSEECLTEFILIMCNENEREAQDMNTVALVTSKMMYFVRVDYQQKRQPVAIAIPLKIVKKIQIGMDGNFLRSGQPMLRIFFEVPKTASQMSPKDVRKKQIPTHTPSDSNLTTSGSSTSTNTTNTTTTARLSPSSTANKAMLLSSGENAGIKTFLAFKQPMLRLFNNMLIEVKRPDDQWESLKAIAEFFLISVKAINDSVEYEELTKMEKLRAEPIAPELQIPININMLYENVLTLQEEEEEDCDDGDYEDDDDLRLKSSEMPASSIQSSNTGYLTDDEEICTSASRTTGTATHTGSGIESLKRSLRSVKDKVKLSDLKDRFTGSTKNTQQIKLRKLEKDPLQRNKEESNKQLETCNSTFYKPIGNGAGGGSSSIEGQDELFTDKDHVQKSSILSRCRLGSVSDDESQRVHYQNTQLINRNKSDKLAIKSSNLTVSNHISLNLSQPTISKSLQSIVNSSQPITINSSDTQSSKSVYIQTIKSIPDHGFDRKIMIYRRNLSVDALNLYKLEHSSDYVIQSSNSVLNSCGIIMMEGGNIKVRLNKYKRRKKKDSIGSLTLISNTMATKSTNTASTLVRECVVDEDDISASLAAVTSGAYQKRVERISLQLSIDEVNDHNLVVDSDVIAVQGSPRSSIGFINPGTTAIASAKKLKNLLASLTTTAQTKKASDTSLTNHDKPSTTSTTNKNIENNSTNQSESNMKKEELCNKENEKEKLNFTYIHVPPVEIRNQKITERLINKQIDLVKYVEDLRRTIHGDNCTLNTKLIIF